MGYELPQIREPGGGVDWRQILDFVIPGNVWNSRSNQYRPIGMAAGAASMLGGPLAGAAVELGGQLSSHMPQMPRFNNPFAGSGTPSPGRERAVVPQWPQDSPPSRATVAAMERAMGAQQPSRGMPMRGGLGGYNGSSISQARGLGESQRRNSDSIMAEQMAFMERMRNRNDALMER